MIPTILRIKLEKLFRKSFLIISVIAVKFLPKKLRSLVMFHMRPLIKEKFM